MVHVPPLSDLLLSLTAVYIFDATNSVEIKYVGMSLCHGCHISSPVLITTQSCKTCFSRLNFGDMLCGSVSVLVGVRRMVRRMPISTLYTLNNNNNKTKLLISIEFTWGTLLLQYSSFVDSEGFAWP